MDTIKVGIIGCGGIADGKHVPSLIKLGNVEIVGLCDIIIERAENIKKKYNLTNARVYSDYKELLNDTSIESVHVCTPNRSHSFITVDALNAGKHVMCEKPMAINYEQAMEMVNASKKTGKLLSIGYQSRYRSDSQYLKTECEKGTLGEIYFAKARALRRRAVPTWGVFLNEYEQGGGPLIDIGTHALDLALWIMNNYKPKYAVGTTYHELNKQRNTANAFGEWDPEEFTVEDSAFGFIVMENLATIILETSWALNTLEVGEGIISVSGTKAGADMFDGLRINGVNNGSLYVTKPSFGAGGVAFYQGASISPETMEAKVFYDAVRGKGELTVLPEQAATVTRILEGIYESAKTGKPYYFN